MDNSASARVTAGTDFPGPGSRTWRPARVLLVGSLVFSAAALVGVVVPRDPIDRVVAGVAAVVLLAIAIAGWRRRLIGGPRGLLIAGLFGARLVPWSSVRGIACGRTKRMGSATLEIDLVDDELILLGRIELGADPDDVAADLSTWFDDRR